MINYQVAKFEVIKWEVDAAFMQMAADPEIQHFDVDVDEAIDYQPIAGLYKKNMNMALAGVIWIFTSTTRTSKKEIVRLELDAEYILDVNDIVFIKEILAESYQRFASIYAQKSAEGGSPDVLPNIQPSYLDQILRDVVALLRK